MNKKLVVVAVMLSVLLIMPATSYQTSMADNFHTEERSIAANVDGNTLHVGGSGPNNYTKIQDAIDEADDGDKIFVYSGVYREGVTIPKSIVLEGENRYNTAISENGTVLKVACDEVTIKIFY